MRPEHGAGRQHDAVARGGLRQRQRVLDMGEPRPDEHPGAGLGEDFESDLLESAHHIDARGVEPLVQPREVLAIVAIDQHQVDETLGELRGCDVGQHLDVGQFVGDVLSAGDESDP